MTEQHSHKVQRDMVCTLAVLTLFYGISFLDRQVLAVLVVPIRATLGISDFQISLVQGLAFPEPIALPSARSVISPPRPCSRSLPS